MLSHETAAELHRLTDKPTETDPRHGSRQRNAIAPEGITMHRSAGR